MMASQPPLQAAPPKRPRLSLKINTCGPALPNNRATRGFPVDPTDPTAFNTLSNAYVTAIERSTPVQAEPLTAINTLQSFTLQTPAESKDLKLRVKTPFAASYPETPVTAHSSSPPQRLDINYPSTMTPTPPMSAGAIEPTVKAFSFSPKDVSSRPKSQSVSSPSSPVESRFSRRLAMPYYISGAPAPYTHPRSLHSILRNSPLPPRTAIPPSPRRQSLRLQEKAAKKVGYNNPLTQTIITNKYIKSHIDLLVEEASPASPSWSPAEPEKEVDLMQAFTANEIQDGGQTPGPFEDMRRRLAGLGAGTPLSPSESGGIRKRKKRDKEKKRQWVWTIGVSEEDEDERAGSAIAAVKAEVAAATATTSGNNNEGVPVASVPEIQMVPETPTASIEGSADSASESVDVDMTDISSAVSEATGPPAPCDREIDMTTPTGPKPLPLPEDGAGKQKRDTPIPELDVNLAAADCK